MARRALLVVNRHARRGGSDLEQALERLRAADWELEEAYPEDPGAIPMLLQEHCGKLDAVILGGGDGTLGRALPAVLGCGVPLGILPLGTANDAARGLGIPADPREAVEVILGGRTERIDVGTVNGVPFLNAANVGLGAAVTGQLSNQEKGRWGVLGYARAVWRALRRPPSFRMNLSDGTHRVRMRAIQLAVVNGRYQGGGMAVHPCAGFDDGRLHAYVMPRAPAWRLLISALAMRLERGPQLANVETLEGERLWLRTRKQLPVSADGEWAAATPAEFGLMRRALPVFVPDTWNREESDAARSASDCAQ